MSSMTKRAAWEEVAKDVSAVSAVKRSAAEVKKKWVWVKSKAKSNAVALKKDRVRTGGGPKAVDDLSELDSRVIDVIGDTCINGVTGGMDLNGLLLTKLTGVCIKMTLSIHYYGLLISLFIS